MVQIGAGASRSEVLAGSVHKGFYVKAGAFPAAR